jgi:hypothetical protein
MHYGRPIFAQVGAKKTGLGKHHFLNGNDDITSATQSSRPMVSQPRRYNDLIQLGTTVWWE